jgi:hypothetical protein
LRSLLHVIENRKDMSYLEKVKKLFDGKLPKSFKLHMHYMEFKPNEEEAAAELFFRVLMGSSKDKKKAKQLGLI